jgi:glutathione S-transferase
MIDVYTADTPNGVKIPIALEEMGAPYKVILVNLSAQEQKREEFLKLNPNGRIPAIVDHEGPLGDPFAVFESGAMLLYLAEKFDALLPADPHGRVNAIAWTFFQVSGVGPMFGQARFWRRRAEANTAAIERYEQESARLVTVLERQLRDTTYLAGETVSIADVAHFGWIDVAEDYAGVDLSTAPSVARWREALRARPAFQRGVAAVR